MIAFNELRYGREIVDGYKSIPFEAIISYMDEIDLPKEQRTFFRTVIRTMDEYLGNLKYKKLKEEQQKAKGKK